MPPLGTPLVNSKFNLNSAGVAGFFGGKEAISAMATVHLYTGRRWLGWYNSPGSYTIAKHFGRVANGRFWDGLFPGPNGSPTVSLFLDGKQGPEYKAALSGTTMKTGHLGYLTMLKCMSIAEKPVEIGERKTAPVYVSYLTMEKVECKTPVKLLPLKDALLGIIPITFSLAACILSALVYDWYSFSMILLGIISSGLASVVIGEGKLVLKSVEPADGSPLAHGVLFGEHDVVVIKGSEQDVNAITKGHFDLETDSQQTDSQQRDNAYHAIGCCSLLLIVQFLLQLLLIPQASLFGQIMFLSSLGVSWVYNSYLSSLEKEKIQADILFKKLSEPVMRRFCTGTRTTMAVFVCLLLFHGVEVSEEERRELRAMVLRWCIPNKTVVWGRWLDKVVEQLLHLPESLPRLEGDRGREDIPEPFPYLAEDDEDRKLSGKDRQLLDKLLGDAKSAITGYFTYRNRLDDESSHQQVNDVEEKTCFSFSCACM